MKPIVLAAALAAFGSAAATYGVLTIRATSSVKASVNPPPIRDGEGGRKRGGGIR